MTLKMLSLAEPWALLPFLTDPATGWPVKWIETRSWTTKYRGPLGLHASKGKDGLRLLVAGALPEIADVLAANGFGLGSTDEPLPMGVVLGTCVLVDVLPIVGRWSGRLEFEPFAGEHRLFSYPDRTEGSLWRTNPNGGPPIDVTSQRPFGDFSVDGKQRYAWILADIKLTTVRCPACWRWWTLSAAADDPTWTGCAVCDDAGACEPIPARGALGLWEWAA